MAAEAVSSTERLIAVLDRLRRHLRDAREGSRTARDDLAVDIQLLLGEGSGYGLLRRACHEIGIPTPMVAGWSSHRVPSELPAADDDGRMLPLTLAIRTSCPPDDPHTTSLPLPTFVQQECVRFAVPGFEPAQSWTWAEIVKKVRNKYGGHVDERPPQWLDELRFYPAAGSDALTLLLWSAGETLLRSVTAQLCDYGISVHPYTPRDRYLGGIDLTHIYILQDASGLDVRAELDCESWRIGFRRAIVGARFGDRPFIFGLEGDGRLSLGLGRENESLREFERQFDESA